MTLSFGDLNFMKYKDTNLAQSIEFTCNCSPSVWWAGSCRGWPGAAAAAGPAS